MQIAISLVPRLVVVSVCLGESGLALGAALLFLSNLVSLVVAGMMLFAVLGYAETTEEAGRSRRQVRLVLAALLVGVTLPLFVNTAVSVMLSLWSSRVDTTAKD